MPKLSFNGHADNKGMTPKKNPTNFTVSFPEKKNDIKCHFFFKILNDLVILEFIPLNGW